MAASVWKGQITFGLVSISVRLLRAAKSERVPLRELYHVPPAEPPAAPSSMPSGPIRIDRKRAEPEPAEAPEPIFEPVRRIAAGQSSAEPRPEASITKGYEYEPGRYVTIAADELRAIVPQTSPNMEIQEFVRLADIDPIYFEASYYVRPEEASIKPYALLYEAMRESQFAAVAEFAMHRRERIAIVRPGQSGLIAHTMYFASEVRSDQEVHADTSLVSPKEVALGKTLIDALAGSFDPAKYRDRYKERLEALIAGKVEGKETVSVPAPAVTRQTTDIMDVLRQSIEALKKPPAAAGNDKRRSSSRTASKR